MRKLTRFFQEEEASVLSYSSLLGAAAVITFVGALQLTGVQIFRMVEPLFAIPERLIN